ncbi:MAG: 3'(2'),5'-bisphosphate nucleotidase CysQ [Gammaproteobacteria bacterium]
MLPTHITQQIINIAGTAAEAIMQVYHSDFSVENKADGSLLTQADLASHQTITQALRTVTPDIPILSEESSSIPWAERQGWQQYWLVDPLDGTREFVKRNDEFTVNIALIEDHAPVFGVVHVPITQVCYYAGKGSGAFKIAAGTTTQIHTRRVGNNIVMGGSRSHAGNREQAFRAALGDNVELVSIGSSLKFCLVAEGKVDVYPRFGPTSEWDTAAAHCIVNEAGGQVLDLDYRPLRYNDKDSLLNPEFIVLGDPSFDWPLVSG